MRVIDNKILINRGDADVLTVDATDDNDKPYTFQVNDVVRLTVMEANDCENVVLQKDTKVTEESTEVDIELTSENTRIGEVISNPVNYWYEVKLNPDTTKKTIIGYDDKGPKIWQLFPEGGKKQ